MLSLVVQAGGESQRMGQDKALVPFLGAPLITRVIQRVAYLATEVIVTTNQPQAYRFLNLPLYPDVLPGRGALGGLYTAFTVAHYPLVALVACDMPFASAALLAAERDALLSTGADAVIPLIESNTEPFHAVYRRETCLAAVQGAIAAEKWRVNAWFGEVQVRFFTAEEVGRYDPDRLAFSNVNTPEELAAAEALARKMETEV